MRVTEAVDRHRVRSVLLDGAVAMDRLFSENEATRDAWSFSRSPILRN
jgi:hypothetical protein